MQKEGIHLAFMDVHRGVCPDFGPSQVLPKENIPAL